MNHLHGEGIVHGDLKAGNVLLKAELCPVAASTASCTAYGTATAAAAAAAAAAGSGGCPSSRANAVEASGFSGSSSGRVVGGGVVHQEQLVAKVADFGLACRLRDQDTHVSGVHRVRQASGI
jgi:serine/threonine protein kinase